MDLTMKAETISVTAHPVWDCKVKSGIVPFISGDEGDLQDATLAGFLETNTIPQLPDAGVNWQDFLTKKITFGELDAKIRDSLNKADKGAFYPQYNLTDDSLTMTINKRTEEEA